MSAATVTNHPVDWDIQTDEEGYRDYNVKWEVAADLGASPDAVMMATGLPLPGAALTAIGGSDPWAFYQRKGSARLKAGDKTKKRWDVTTVFSNRPIKRCSQASFEDPLSEPPKIKGGFNRFQKEVREDSDGNAILNSSKEPITGIQRDNNRPTLELEMNVAWLDLYILGQYIDAVNAYEWWEQEPRTIKCCSFSWEYVLYGLCYRYFHCTFGFELNPETWDFRILDQGNMVLVPGANPPQYRRAKDTFEETVRVLLDGNGNATTEATYLDPIEVYQALDFSVVGWPVTLF